MKTANTIIAWEVDNPQKIRTFSDYKEAAKKLGLARSGLYRAINEGSEYKGYLFDYLADEMDYE